LDFIEAQLDFHHETDNWAHNTCSPDFQNMESNVPNYLRFHEARGQKQFVYYFSLNFKI
jgi:hypothetical protein